MIQTNNYEFNIVEGNDIVNPLVQLNPNFTKLDTILKAVADSGIGTALQVKSGINHAITKDDDCAVFKFVATADYRTGDTFSLNGDTVTLRCMDGTVPKDRAFVINQTVECAINGTLLTLIGGAGSVGASDVEYNNQNSGMTAVNVQEAIDELKGEIDAVPIIDNASDVDYDNTTSGLSATDVQGAIDEIAANSQEIVYQDYPLTLLSNASVTPFTSYSAIDISGFQANNIVISTNAIVPGSGYRVIVNASGNTLHAFGLSTGDITIRVAGIKR